MQCIYGHAQSVLFFTWRTVLHVQFSIIRFFIDLFDRKSTKLDFTNSTYLTGLEKLVPFFDATDLCLTISGVFLGHLWSLEKNGPIYPFFGMRIRLGNLTLNMKS